LFENIAKRYDYTPEIIPQICGIGEVWETFKSQSPLMDTQHEKDSNLDAEIFSLCP
jgi:hypothetical protein